MTKFTVTRHVNEVDDGPNYWRKAMTIVKKLQSRKNSPFVESIDVRYTTIGVIIEIEFRSTRTIVAEKLERYKKRLMKNATLELR